MKELGPSALNYASPGPPAASRAAWKYYGVSGALSALAFILVPLAVYLLLERRLAAWPLLLVAPVDWVGALAVAIAGLRRDVRPRVLGVLCVVASAVGLLLFLVWVLLNVMMVVR